MIFQPTFRNFWSRAGQFSVTRTRPLSSQLVFPLAQRVRRCSRSNTMSPHLFTVASSLSYAFDSWILTRNSGSCMFVEIQTVSEYFAIYCFPAISIAFLCSIDFHKFLATWMSLALTMIQSLIVSFVMSSFVNPNSWMIFFNSTTVEHCLWLRWFSVVMVFGSTCCWNLANNSVNIFIVLSSNSTCYHCLLPTKANSCSGFVLLFNFLINRLAIPVYFRYWICHIPFSDMLWYYSIYLCPSGYDFYNC